MEKIIKYSLIALFGFIAQMIDGGLGMGYGVSSTSLLLTMGFGTALASACVHMSEIFTTFISGVSHFKLGNLNKKILTYLTISGVFGGILGAYSSVKLQNIDIIKPFVSGILLILGVLIIIKYIRKHSEIEYRIPRIRRLAPLGFVAAFVDAIGGGGWGPIATPTLVVNNTHPSKAIGSVNFAEFFVTVAISTTFFLMLPEINWSVVVSLLIGGVIAAPIAATLTKKINHKVLGILVGTLIIFLSLRTILKAIGVGFFF